MIKHVIYTGTHEVYAIFPHTRNALTSATREEIEDWLLECDLWDCTNRVEFDTEEEARKYLATCEVSTELEQANTCKVVCAKYALYEKEWYDDDDYFDHDEIEDIKCAGLI